MPNDPKEKKQPAGSVQEHSSVQVRKFAPEHADKIRKVLSDNGFTLTEDGPNNLVGVGACCLDGEAQEHVKNAVAFATNGKCSITIKAITTQIEKNGVATGR